MVSDPLMAKGSGPPQVPPVIHENMEYQVLYSGVGGEAAQATLQARQISSPHLLWKTVLYTTHYDRKKETDVQDVWPVSLALEGDLIVENEQGYFFRVKNSTGELQNVVLTRELAIRIAKTASRLGKRYFQYPYVASVVTGDVVWTVKLESHGPEEGECAAYFIAVIDAHTGLVLRTSTGGGA